MARESLAEIPGHAVYVRKRARNAKVVQDATLRWQVTCTCGAYPRTLHATPLAARTAAQAHIDFVNPLVQTDL